MRSLLLPLAGAVLLSLAPIARALPSGERVWLQSYLDFPIENLRFTAGAMGYLGPVKEVVARFDIGDARGAAASSRETVVRFYPDGRAAEETDRDLLAKTTVFHAVYSYNTRNQIAEIRRSDYVAGTVETIGFQYDAQGFLVGATMERNGRAEQSVAIANTSAGKPLLVTTRLADGREVSRIAYTYTEHGVRIAYTAAGGAERVVSAFTLDADGRPVAATTERRDTASVVDYDGVYRYTYRADGDTLFHGVEDHPHALPQPTRCVIDREFFKNGALRHAESVGDDITCDRPGPDPEIAFDAEGNVTRSRLGAYEHAYAITYYTTPSM
ncbi:MAG TPA: hypothetical protein VN766_12855 [Stellaceae bacterium]|jgi:hypothetical protein|nr:hypothetical protein [Stellaceae bacterium]